MEKEFDAALSSMKFRLFRKKTPLWVSLLIVVMVGGASFATAPSIRAYVALQAEVVDVTTTLTVTLQGFDAAKKNAAAQGDSIGTAQTMVPGVGGDSHTAITKGNWVYKVDIDSITGTTPAGTTFSVSLKQDGVVIATLYVASDATPTTGEHAIAEFDLGATIPTSVSYVVEVMQA